MAQLQLDIVTPDATLVSKKVDYVGLTGVEGEFGILPDHMPMLAALCVGKLHYKIGGETHYVFICGGFAEILNNTVTVLTEAGELAGDIDVQRAQMAKKRAEERLKKTDAAVDETRAQAALMRAVTRLEVASMRS